MKNRYAIGDVHGCHNTLMELIAQLPKDAELIFVGDLCDKGKFSKEVIEFVIQNNYKCVKGNHETLMHKSINDVLYNDIFDSDWYSNDIWGGRATAQNYKADDKLLQSHLLWIESLPLYIEIDNYFITHGYGLPYYQRKNSIKHIRALLSNRIDDEEYKHDWEDTTSYEKINIFGHCNFSEVVVGKNYYGIDTGCVYGNKLTAIELNTLKIFQQKLNPLDILKSKND